MVTLKAHDLKPTPVNRSRKRPESCTTAPRSLEYRLSDKSSVKEQALAIASREFYTQRLTLTTSTSDFGRVVKAID